MVQTGRDGSRSGFVDEFKAKGLSEIARIDARYI